jgi:peptide chain release factor 2
VQEIEAAMSAPDFWQNRDSADRAIRELGELQDKISRFAEIEEGLSILREKYDEDLFYETRRKFRQFELEELFKGKYDRQAAVISIYPGAGGDDAADWARMLQDMYEKYAVRRGWKVVTVDDSPGHRAIELRGEYAYGYLRRESGVHRLVRISPFSSQKLRHTSFALVDVTPDIPAMEESKIDIPEKDMKFEFYRAGGPGGQNVNKVETAVRVVHIPTGLATHSQVERSQAANRVKAVRLLKAKLIQLMEKHQTEEMDQLKTKAKPDFGHAIRHYFLHPYQVVKDDRTGAETSQAEKVLQGDLDLFIEAEVSDPDIK